jgi:hypothetical protein
MNAHVFDRSGIAALDDLTAPACRELFLAMEREQAVSGRLWRYSATYLVAVSPRPKPDSAPNMPTVPWIIP